MFNIDTHSWRQKTYICYQKKKKKEGIFEGRKLVFIFKYKECYTMQEPVTVMIVNKNMCSGP